ncbi:MAG: hypothetical protein ACRCXT_11880 [Paraclostridium sp.]
MKRKIISSLGVSVLIFNVLLSTPIFANEYETNLEIQNEERYTHVDKASSNLKISGGVATVTASMTANPGVSKTLITSRLQKKVNGSWETVQAWTETSSTISCKLNKSISVSKGSSYRIFSTVKAYKGADAESIAIYSNIVNY